MTQGLIRLQHSGQSHFVTFSCYRRQARLNPAAMCDLYLKTLEKTRQQFSLRVYGYVVMPEHVHLLLSEPGSGSLADAIHFLKLSSAKQSISEEHVDGGHFWQKRYYDRNIRSYSDFMEKLRYIHRNPAGGPELASFQLWEFGPPTRPSYPRLFSQAFAYFQLTYAEWYMCSSNPSRPSRKPSRKT
jgi:putative transposase